MLEKVFTRINITCQSNIEVPYYNTYPQEPLCIYCGGEEVEPGTEYYPICTNCSELSLRPKRKRQSRPTSNAGAAQPKKCRV